MASKRAVRRKKCKGHVKYEEWQAKGALKSMRRDKPGEHFTMFKCGWCHAWHIGHTPGKNMRVMQ
jgi:hypothetical protein